MKVIFFDQQIKKFISKLERSSFAKTLQMIGLIEELGPNLRMPYSKK